MSNYIQPPASESNIKLCKPTRVYPRRKRTVRETLKNLALSLFIALGYFLAAAGFAIMVVFPSAMAMY